jgi:hypothetical protein
MRKRCAVVKVGDWLRIPTVSRRAVDDSGLRRFSPQGLARQDHLSQTQSSQYRPCSDWAQRCDRRRSWIHQVGLVIGAAIPFMRAASARAPTQHGGSVEKDKRREAGPLLAIGRIAVLRFYVEDWLGDNPRLASSVGQTSDFAARLQTE